MIEIDMCSLYWRIVCRPYLGKVALIGAGTFLAGIAEIASVALIIPVVALFLGGESPSGKKFAPLLEAAARWLGIEPTSTRLLFVALAGVFLFILLKSVLVLGLNYLTAVVAKGAQRTLTLRMFNAFAHARFSELTRRIKGEMVEDIRKPPDTVNYVIYQSGLAIAAAGQLVVTLWFLLWLAPDLTLLIGAVGCAIILGFRRYTNQRLAELGRAGYELNQRSGAMIGEALDGVRVVKVHNLADHLRDRLNESLTKHMHIEIKALQLDQMPKIVFELAGMFIVVLLIACSVVVPSMRLDFPVLAAFVMALRQMTPALSTLNTTLMKAAQNWRQLEVIDETLERLPQEDDRGGTAPLPAEIRALSLEGVAFAYPERPDRDVFHSLSLTFARGRVTALVGGTGAGKTTIADMIIRLQEPTGGRIAVDGVDIRQFSLVGWRERIGYVGQDVFLFNATLGQNIAGLDDHVPTAEIERAARLAQIHDFIVSLPDGYDTSVGDRGVTLSGGQRQRIAVARAILKRPKILILDEATSALDNLTERALHEAIDFMRHEAIVILIAHRLSTVEDADEIVVLHDGQVVERGGHASLLARQGLYAQLYRATPEAASVVAEPVPVPEEPA